MRKIIHYAFTAMGITFVNLLMVLRMESWLRTENEIKVYVLKSDLSFNNLHRVTVAWYDSKGETMPVIGNYLRESQKAKSIECRALIRSVAGTYPSYFVLSDEETSSITNQFLRECGVMSAYSREEFQ